MAPCLPDYGCRTQPDCRGRQVRLRNGDRKFAESLSMPSSCVLIGGGDFAVEIATYITDIRASGSEKIGPISDIVAGGRVRMDAFEKVLCGAPTAHETLGSVVDLQGKLCVIAVGDPRLRHRLMQEVLAAGGKLGSVVHPSAYVAATAIVGSGTIISPMAFVGPFAQVGRNCAINVHAIVGHDVVLGDCVVLSPGADINGHGGAGTCAFLGAGAIVSPKVTLGAYSKLAAGSVLNRSTEEGYLMHGNPASGRQMFRRP